MKPLTVSVDRPGHYTSLFGNIDASRRDGTLAEHDRLYHKGIAWFSGLKTLLKSGPGSDWAAWSENSASPRGQRQLTDVTHARQPKMRLSQTYYLFTFSVFVE